MKTWELIISSDRLLFSYQRTESEVNFTSERKANSVANEKQTTVDRLFWNFSKGGLFFMFFNRRQSKAREPPAPDFETENNSKFGG